MAPKIRRCAISGCTASSVSEDGKMMHRFPRRICRLKHCVTVSGNEDLLNLSPIKIHQDRYICPKHFTNSQYFDGEHRSYLGSWAKPTLHLPEPLTEEPSWPDVPVMAGAANHVSSSKASPLTGASSPLNGATVAADRDDAVRAGGHSEEPLWFSNPGTSMPPHSVSAAEFTPEFSCKSAEVLSPFGKRLREEDEEAPDLDLKHLEPPAKVVVCEVVEARRRSTETLGARDRSHTPKSRMSQKKLASMSGVNPSSMSDDAKKIVRTAFQYRRMVMNIKSQLTKTQKANASLLIL
ncbi:uncharacterized protein LOC117643337 [Thrips palmi]|uniref:Uncharacterized protein LOC117643337 n=1 Tax=Thrips palmi TaxID=161013 RepID=A0A6P8ZL17_THRPL|nr:uncharacterized protein LOC117643337 [Thrips palmi]